MVGKNHTVEYRITWTFHVARQFGFSLGLEPLGAFDTLDLV
jgi:hypothetical protein